MIAYRYIFFTIDSAVVIKNNNKSSPSDRNDFRFSVFIFIIWFILEANIFFGPTPLELHIDLQKVVNAIRNYCIPTYIEQAAKYSCRTQQMYFKSSKPKIGILVSCFRTFVQF